MLEFVHAAPVRIGERPFLFEDMLRFAHSLADEGSVTHFTLFVDPCDAYPFGAFAIVRDPLWPYDAPGQVDPMTKGAYSGVALPGEPVTDALTAYAQTARYRFEGRSIWSGPRALVRAD